MDKEILKQRMAMQVAKKLLGATNGTAPIISPTGKVINLEAERLKRRPS